MTVSYAAIAADGTRVEYRDRKRAWWMLSVVYPLLPFAGIAAHAASGWQIVSHNTFCAQCWSRPV